MTKYILSLFGLALVALAGLISATASPAASQSSRAQTEPGRKRPFIHLDHVPSVWANGKSAERLRDCRGCHVYGEKETRDPQAVCSECHLAVEATMNTFRPIFAEGWETLDQHREPNALFQHYTHATLTCRECHQPDDGIPSDPMPVRRSFSECARCHGLNASESLPEVEYLAGTKEQMPESARLKLLDALNRLPAMSPEELGPFSHAEHVKDPQQSFKLSELLEEGPKPGRCTSCHEPVVHSGLGGPHEKRFRREACAECHVGEHGALEFGATVEAAESRAAGTFSHSDHLEYERGKRDTSMSTELGYEQIEDQGCHACHEYSSEAATFVSMDVANHEGCRSCHASEDWKVAQHGDWQAWGCKDCHDFKQAGTLDRDRPKTLVRRRASTAFQIETQAHPHVAGERETKLFQGVCSDCHRARVKELPSRLGTRKFSHATHLPANPTPQHCDLCHGSRVRLAGSSSAISESFEGKSIEATDFELRPLLGTTFDMQACTECHRGGVLKTSLVEYNSIEPSQVTEFSHVGHIGKTDPFGAPIDCLSCHQPQAEKGASIGTSPAAMMCTQCHNHTPGASSEISGQASAVELARCSKCHVESIPAAEQSFAIDRIRLANLVGTDNQFHPSDRDCDECHQGVQTEASDLQGLGTDHVFAEGGRHLEGRLVKRQQHYGVDGESFFLRDIGGVDCLWCHWAQGIPNFDFESEAYREKKGNVLEAIDKTGTRRSFPGGAFRRQFGG